MSHAPARRPSVSSIPTSGRSSPVPRATRRDVEGDLFRADKGLRRYAATIERTLSTWEISPEEWADYIAFLARLLKAIQTHPKDAPLLPHSKDIATRLAQCLNPALPSGVHSKSLEVYAYIFSAFGNSYISAHLHEFLPGLAAVLSFASLSVRPALYELFEENVVHLPRTELRPALKALVLGLLPALEEGQGDDFERAFSILRALQSEFTPTQESAIVTDGSDGYFWQCLFLAVITSPSRRQGALNYMLRSLPRFPSGTKHDTSSKSQTLPREIESIVSPEPGLLVRCFVAGLSDEQVLVQRGFLDLMVSNIPLDSVILQSKVGTEDLDRLVSAATHVILRKDMSLNRRLWSWFLGPEPKDQTSASPASSPEEDSRTTYEGDSTSQLKYFSSYGRSSLERVALQMLHSTRDGSAARARPFRILSALMDRWEIGGLLVPTIFLPAMRSLFAYSQRKQLSDVAEVVRSANTFFDGVEASLIWSRLLTVLMEALEQNHGIEQNLQFFSWVIETFNVRDEEMTTMHIPLVLLYLSTHADNESLAPIVKAEVLAVSAKLLDLIPTHVLQSPTPTSQNDKTTSQEDLSTSEKLRAAVHAVYQSADNGGSTDLPYSLATIVKAVSVKATSASATAALELQAEAFHKAISLRIALLDRAFVGWSDQDLSLLTALSQVYCTKPRAVATSHFPMIATTVTLLTAFHDAALSSSQYIRHISELEPALTSQIWAFLSPDCSKYHVEAVRALWQLVDALPDKGVVQASILSLVAESIGNDDAEGCRRFTVLWTHSVASSQMKATPARRGSAMNNITESQTMRRAQDFLEQLLLLALDSLNDTSSAASKVVQSWLHRTASLDQIFERLFRCLQSVLAIVDHELSPAHRKRMQANKLQLLFHILGHFVNIFRIANDWVWDRLATILVPSNADSSDLGGTASLVESCMQCLESDLPMSLQLRRRLVTIIHMVVSSPAVSQLADLTLDARLFQVLMACVTSDTSEIQIELLELIQLTLDRLPTRSAAEQQSPEPRNSYAAGAKRSTHAPASRLTSRSATSLAAAPPAELFKCMQLGFSAPQARHYLDQWLQFFANVLPKYADVVLANLIPLVETFCGELKTTQQELMNMASTAAPHSTISPDQAAVSLLDGLETLLDRAYESLLSEAEHEPAAKEPETRPNFFSNVASGVFRSDSSINRASTSNSRLTVILAFQDAIRVSMSMWLWASNIAEMPDFDASSASTTAYHALKVRNKTRHALEQIFSLEPLESLEVVIFHWWAANTDAEAASSLNILHVMQITRPKSVVPAILDALCSRTNPSSIPAARHSSLTLDLEPGEVCTFFSAYLNSMEDDAIDEVWSDCLAFLRDVLANPLPYRQVLSQLLSIILLLAEKLSNTNFGEQRKMRRDLGDLFQRLLTATFTTLPSGYILEQEGTGDDGDVELRRDRITRSMTLMPVLERITSRIELILDTPERIAATVSNISQALVAPMLRAKSFPSNVTNDLLSLVVHISRKAPASKSWKKEVGEAFNDPKLLSATPSLMESGWFEVIHQWSLHDKERMTELLSRLTPPSSAGIMFGVGASAARLEADRRTQLNLRRISILLLASPEDTHIAHLRAIEEKLAELFVASPSSSPSATIKAELFLLCRAIALSLSSFQLSPLWPIINDNLQEVLTSQYPSATNQDQFNNLTILQACRLLDLLITLCPDEFQLHQWLYITDTIDAVYHPHDWTPAALTDQIAEALGTSSMEDSLGSTAPGLNASDWRRQLITDEMARDKDDIKAMARDDFVRTVVRPFLSQLSIHAYEGVYSLESPDIARLRRSVLVDLLDLGSVVG